MKDFFISYNKTDRDWAEGIAWHLEESGYTTVLQAWDFRPGANFILEMDEAASQSARTIAVLSPNYLAAQYTKPEWAAALAQDPMGEGGKLLPVRVRECELKGILSQVILIDLVGLEEGTAKNTLLAEIRRTRSKPVTPPAFPGELPRSVMECPHFPGALPRIWNVPNQNHNFTGREEYLDALRRQLTSGHHAVLTQAISGLGGIGKTQLGIEYSYRYAANYDAVWWIRAEEPLTLAEDYARLACKLELKEKDEADQKKIIEAVRARLGRSANWLLIFDNARSRTDIIDYLPQGGGGHVIITSRNPNWRGAASSLSLALISVAEGLDFISKRTGQTDGSAASLVNALGGLPLALEQAGAYMEATGKSIVDYLRLFQTHQQELLRRGRADRK